MLIYFGVALLNYDAIAARFGRPTVLPLEAIAAASASCSSFLYLPNRVAMVALA